MNELSFNREGLHILNIFCHQGFLSFMTPSTALFQNLSASLMLSLYVTRSPTISESAKIPFTSDFEMISFCHKAENWPVIDDLLQYYKYLWYINVSRFILPTSDRRSLRNRLGMWECQGLDSLSSCRHYAHAVENLRVFCDWMMIKREEFQLLRFSF